MFTFSTEEKLVIKSLQEFVENEVKPVAVEMSQSNEFPKALWNRCVELGFIGVSMPEEFGGMGLPKKMEKLVLEEIAKEYPALALAIDAHHLACRNIIQLGTEAQKKKYLPDMVFGEKIGAAAACEATGVLIYLETRDIGTPTEDGLILNCTKIFCTNSSAADLFTVSGMMNGNYCTVIVERDMEGVQAGDSLVEHKLGMHGSGTGTVRLTNVHVPYENICIPENFTPADSLSTAGCYLDISAISLGIAESVFEKTKEYTMGRMRNGKPLAALQVVAHHLADMKCKVELMRSVLYRAMEAQDAGDIDLLLIHITKATVPELACEVAEMAIKLHGGVGYMEAAGIARYLRDAICNTIGENPTDFHKDQIALQLDIPIDTSIKLYQKMENNEVYR